MVNVEKPIYSLDIPPIEYTNLLNKIDKLERIRDGHYSNLDKRMKDLKEKGIILSKKEKKSLEDKKKLVKMEVKYWLLYQKKFSYLDEYKNNIFELFKDFFANHERLLKEQFEINLELFLNDATRDEIARETTRAFLKWEYDFLTEKDREVLSKEYSELYYNYLVDILV